MRCLTLALALALAACATDPPAAPAGGATPDPAAQDTAAADTDLDRFFARFQEAVRDGDRAALLALTDFSQGGTLTEDEFAANHLGALLDPASPVRARVLAASADELTPDEEGRQVLEVFESEQDAGGNTLYESLTVLSFGQNAAGQYRLVDYFVAG
ncbi:MAG: hypothetical protein ACK41D_11340 [Rubricoccaceae bacterium]